MYARFARALVLIAAMVVVALPNAATAQAQTDSFQAWLSWDCDKSRGYVDIRVKLQKRSPGSATYNVALAPGDWGSQRVTLQGSGDVMRLSTPFKVTANGVNRVVLQNTATGERTEQHTQTVTCTQLRDNPAATGEPQAVSQKDRPAAAKTKPPAAAGAGTVAAPELNGQARLGEQLIQWGVVVLIVCSVGIGITVFARYRFGF